MGFELKEKFDNLMWYHNHKGNLIDKIINLPTYIRQQNENEFWLKEAAFAGTWEFDVRIFLTQGEIFIEVSTFSKAFTEDIKYLHEYMSNDTLCQLLDDDDEVYNFDRNSPEKHM
jgi:uncharacterized NAD(P)/FAD-binding protein YdhS